MRRTFVTLCLCGLAVAPAFADWDAKLEAEEAARRQQAAAAERAKQAQAKAALDAASLQAARAALGKEAVGKPDAEVRRLYDEKMKREQAAARKAAAEAPQLAARAQKIEADTRPQRDALMKQNYGKSIKELEGMSDAELEKFARELEKKHGR